MRKFTKSHRQDDFPGNGVVIVLGANLVQITIETLGCDAVKAIDPLLETAVIGIDVLNKDNQGEASAS
jgi:hypothetical protein